MIVRSSRPKHRVLIVDQVARCEFVRWLSLVLAALSLFVRKASGFPLANKRLRETEPRAGAKLWFLHGVGQAAEQRPKAKSKVQFIRLTQVSLFFSSVVFLLLLPNQNRTATS